MGPFVDIEVNRQRGFKVRHLRHDDGRAALGQISDKPVVVEGFVGMKTAKSIPLIKGATPILSWRCPGKSEHRTRLPSASVNARILVLSPALKLAIAGFCVPFLRPVHGGEPGQSSH